VAHHAGIDTGGTFTDLVVLDDATGRVTVAKQPSTPSAPARAVFDCLAAAGIEPADLASITLGTTVGTNALLERKGARVILLTTAGFEDVTSIGRIDKEDPYDLRRPKHEPFVARRDCIGVRERLAPDGSVVVPLSEAELERVGTRVEKSIAGTEGEVAIAVSLLFAYADASHERRLGGFLAERFPDVPVSASHRAAPVWREHERTTTTVVDAYLTPVLRRLAGELETALARAGFTGSVSIMKSNGGHMLASVTPTHAVQTVLSGLAGGIVAGRHFGLAAGSRNVVTFDMGGTSADIGLVRDGEIQYVPDFELEFGLPIATPAIDLVTIGAGGGSIAWVDDGGLLRVGPSSAGAVPGPACYGLGGTEPTVTDANLVLGRLAADSLLGGQLRLDPAAALVALTRLGEQVGLDAVAAAESVIEVANEGMAGTIRRVAVERGVDPRDFELVAFGGAGPLHAAEIAAALGMAGVVVPPHPGLASASGTLLADRRVDRRATFVARSDAVELGELSARLAELERDARAALAREGFAGEPTVVRSVSTRYAGQNHELEVPLDLAAPFEAFHVRHHEVYGYSFPDEVVELTHLNVAALGPGARPWPIGLPEGELPLPRDARDVRFLGESLATPVFRRDELPGGASLRGPAIVEELDSTTLVLPGQELRVRPDGILRLAADGAAGARRAVDSVTVSIVGDQLVQIAQEMGTHMMRAAYSPIFSESRDFSCALFDRRGRMIAQGRFNPAHLGAIGETVRCVLEELGVAAFEPGDVVVHNDPFRGGCHLPEHMLLRPVFREGELVAFAATIGHMAEIGAVTVGSFAATATEVYQEGLRLPPVKLVKAGEPVEDVWKIVLSNHRTPRLSWGDLHAMIGSLELADRRLQALFDRHGVQLALEVSDELLAHGERLMRRRIEAIPDGEYVFEDVMEGDGLTRDPVTMRVRLVVSGDRAIVDWTGSDPQSRGPVNATYGVTVSATCNAFLQVSGTEIPRNAGSYGCVKTIAPPGSVVNVRFPGPSVGGNTETQPKLVGMLLGALAETMPDRVMAAEGATACNFLFGGIHPETGEPYAHYHFEASGWGGRSDGDGQSAQNHVHGNCRNTPVEVFETRFPFRTLSYGLIPDSGGPGRHRGGLAVRRDLEVLAPEVTVSAMLDRVESGAWGLFGGLPGRCAALLVRRAGDDRFRDFCEAFGTVSPSKLAGVVLRQGDVVRIESAGGGGFGDPRERDPELVLADVGAGLVTREEAERAYGVALTAEGRADGGSTPSGPDDVHARLVALLREEGVTFRLTHHEPVTTSAEAAAVRGAELRSGAKAMLVKGRAGFVLAVLAADRKVDWKLLAPLVGGKGARFADDDELLEATGLRKGAVPPFGVLFGLPTIYDRSLLEVETVNFNAGTHTDSVSMARDDLIRIGGGEVAAFSTRP
jgi:N-methylhydantoinase A/oxoprolinase/acetone carboxylase beta subunit/N-methylhydantoinase B/oxoprolinase/acetone carboxylase alpha subunit/prolyl-tRNA editing enzyme YbaK/EbsC (Cys-tRNA(Pro) deacylase)